MSSIEAANQIIKVLANQKPETSLSFVIEIQDENPFQTLTKIAEDGMGGNMPKMREAVLDVLNELVQHEAGQPINVNFTEYELKGLAFLAELVEKELA